MKDGDRVRSLIPPYKGKEGVVHPSDFLGALFPWFVSFDDGSLFAYYEDELEVIG